MSDFKEVSLGFAEFVSQLIQETFDAVLSSQNYQLEKYAELESKINLPNSVFVKNYISPEEIEAKKIEIFGFKIQKRMVVNESLLSFMVENFESEEKLVFNKLLTNMGFDAISDFIINLMASNHKSILRSLLNQSTVSKLVIDSGEISAKLELSNLYSEETATTKKATTKALLRKDIVLPTKDRKVSVINHKDAKTGKDTILINKNDVADINNTNFQIPNVRLSVKPTKLTTSSNLYSEIKIKFRTA